MNTDAVRAVVTDICDGNPGAINVMMDLAITQPDGEDLLRELQRRGVRGPNIWCLFKDTHRQDIDALAADLRAAAA